MSKTQFHKIDLTLPTADADLAAIWKREGVDTVVHAAFLSTPTHANAWAHELESIGTMHVLNACAETPGAQAGRLVADGGLRRASAQPELPDRGARAARRTRRARASSRTRSRSSGRCAASARSTPTPSSTTLRTAATLGPTIRNFATRFFSRPVAPTLMGYDPLMQFVHERDVVDAFSLAVDNDFAGEFNIVGDGVLPYSTILAMMGKVPLPMPHFLAYPLSRGAVGDAGVRLAAATSSTSCASSASPTAARRGA